MAGCTEDVATWLDKLGIPEYTDRFLSAGYTSVQQCVTLSKDDLSDIGITKMGHVCRLFRDLERMKSDGEFQRSPSPAGMSPLKVSPADVVSSTSSKDVPAKSWNNPLRRLASFLTHTKSDVSPVSPSQKALPRRLKFSDSDDDPPSRFQRALTLPRTIAGTKFFRRHSTSVARHQIGSSSKNGDVIMPPVSSNGYVSSGDVSATVHNDLTDDASSSPPSPKELTPPPLPPKDPVASSAADSVPSLPACKSDSLQRKDEHKVPNELPPKLPAKKSNNATSRAVKTSDKSNPYDVPKHSKYKTLLVANGKETQQNDTKEQPLLPLRPIPSHKTVVTSPLLKLNNRGNDSFLAAVPENQAPTLSPPHSDDSDTESDHDETFVREAAVITDKYVSIHNDNKSGSVNIFVSKPHCVVENSESSDEEGDCNGDATVRRALSPNTSSLSPNAKITGMELLNLPVKMPAKDEDSINSLSTTAQKPVQSLPPLVIKHSKVISPPLSAPPVETMSPLLSLSAVKCTSSDEIPLLSTDSVIGVYSQLQLPPEETQKQEKENAYSDVYDSSKEQMIVKKRFKVKYPHLVEKIKTEVQKITQGSGIHSVKVITDPFCAVEIEGTTIVMEQAEPKISGCFASLESKMSSSTLQFVNSFTRPALNSPEFLQLCKELRDDLDISLKIRLQPKPVLSAAVIVNKADVMVQLCEGDIALDSCNTFINLTDGNLTMADEVKAMLSQVEINRYVHHIEFNGSQPAGKALYFGSKKKSTSAVIIHAVLPVWRGGNSGEGDLIVSAVLESLKLAMKYRATSVCLPFISCIDNHLPLDVLAESCLTAVHNFTMQFNFNYVKMIRLVLPVHMTEKFQSKFTSGVFNQYIITEDLVIIDPDNMKEFCDLGNSAWLWKNDDGKYNFFQPEDNKTLNKESSICFNSSCTLKIGPSLCRVNFKSMTQTNLCTLNTRKVASVPLGCVWQFRNKEHWELFPPQVTLMIEAMYVTGTDNNLTINSCTYSYNFKHMTQVNVDNKCTTKIRRIDGAAVFDDTHNTAKSKITILGSPEDINLVEEKLLHCLKSVIFIHHVDVQRRFIPAVEKCIKQTQRTNIVKIVKVSETDVMVKFSITGYKDCVQKAAIDMYKVTAMASFSVRRPLEWEPQSSSIELKDILRGSPEWSKICARMRVTLKCNVISIQRIQNQFLWEKYVQHKELMSHKGLQSMLEMELFHGTRSNPPNYIYESEEGFDMRYSREGMWGLGNYFAENANYASCFAYKTTDGVLQLFLVKVLVGDSCEILPDSTLRMPPFKADGKVRYDTVNGVSKGSRVCITYANDKAYPFYLISYTLTP